MAAPRVFISSTYYDLKHVRNDIEDFIHGLGYIPVLHDKGGVAYTQTDTVEDSCYNELAGCDIVICIIGNHFGSQSSNNSNFSITMEELQTAIKNKKKIYIFIAKDVYIENRTYLENKDSGTFKPAYADDIKIHQFIEELRKTVKNNPIESFETTADIISSLRAQFAGLFQNLLVREASLTESKTAYDLQEATERFKELLSAFQQESEQISKSFDYTLLATNTTISYLRTLLGMKASAFIVKNHTELEEFLHVLGFSGDEADKDDPFYQYSRTRGGIHETLKIHVNVFDSKDGWRLRSLPLSQVMDFIHLESAEDGGEAQA